MLYLTSSTGLFAIFALDSNNNGTMSYVIKDHQGSMYATVTGNTVERYSFDAWGRRRNPQTLSYDNVSTSFDRGYTLHEHYDDFGLINMNGRMYDPEFATFLSPDNYVQDPTSQQSFNRYAYCMYNPLKYVDPTGERYYGWNGGSTYYAEQEYRALMRQRYDQYLELMSQTRERIEIFANSLWSQGDSGSGGMNSNYGNGGGHHGSHGGGNSPHIDVWDNGDGTYTVVGGELNSDHSIVVINGDNAGSVIGTYLTNNSYVNEYDEIVTGALIDLNDTSGQETWDEWINDLPWLWTYVFNKNEGGRNGGKYDFKAIGMPEKLSSTEQTLYYYRGMSINFGDGVYITTARDIGNVFAGYMAAMYSIPYYISRWGFDRFQKGPEPPVSRYAQDYGYHLGRHILINALGNSYYYHRP